MAKKKEQARQEKKNYLLRSFDTYIGSFRSIRWDILLMAVYDLLFFYIIFNIGLELFNRIMEGVTRLSAIRPPQGLDIAMMTMHVQIIKSVYLNSIQDIIIAVLLAIFIYSIFKSLIWLRVMDKKPEWSYLSGFFITSIIWFAAWTLLCLAAYFLFTPKAVMVVYIIVTVLLLHLTPIMNIQLAKTSRKIFSVKKAFKLGFARIHHFIIPYILLAASFVVAYVVLGLIFRAIKIMPEAATVILIIYLMLYLAWQRIYLAKVVEGIR